MFEEIKQHNALVRDQIFKGIVGGEELLEKAHQEGDIHPNGKWRWTKLSNGKYDWRAIKQPKQVTYESLTDAERDAAIKILEKKDPDSYDGKTLIIGMTDEDLQKFRAVAEHFRFSMHLNQSTRDRVKKFANFAADQMGERRRDQEREQKRKREESLESRKTKAITDLHKYISAVPCDIDIKVHGEDVTAYVSPQHVAGCTFEITAGPKESSWRFPGLNGNSKNTYNDNSLQEYAKFIADLSKKDKISNLVGVLRNVVK